MSRSRETAFNLMGLTALAGPWVVTLALPVFDGGVFRQVETVDVGLHVLTLVASAAMAMLALSRPDAIRRAIDVRIAALAAIGVVGLLLLPWADDAARSLHGTLEYKVGALWFVETAALSLAAALTWRTSPAWRTPLAVSAAGSVAFCAVLQKLDVPYGGTTFVPYDFPEYLGLNAMLAAVPLLALRRRWATLAAVAIAVGGVALAGNRSAGLGLAIAGVCLVIARSERGRRALPVLGVAGVLAMTVFVCMIAPALESLATRGVTSDANPVVASADPRDHVAIMTKPYGTLWDRSVTARMVLRDLEASPTAWVVGHGFGAFEGVTQVHNREAPGRRMVKPTETASLTYWDGDLKARFHSHNALLELVLSIGVAGAIAWFAFVAGIARQTRRETAAAGAMLLGCVAVGGTLWFFVNAAAPLFAIALAATAGPGTDAVASEERGRVGSRSRLAYAGVAGTVALAGAACAFLGLVALAGEHAERAFPKLVTKADGSPVCVGLGIPTTSGAEADRALYRILVRWVANHADGTSAEFDRKATSAANYSCLMRRYAAAGDVLPLIESLEARWAFYQGVGPAKSSVEDALGPDFGHWRDDLDLVLAKAPGRTDLVIPYVKWISDGLTDKIGQQDVAQAYAHFEPLLPETDPVRHWILGQVDKQAARPIQYRAHILDALHLGLANVMPVGARDVSSLQEAAR